MNEIRIVIADDHPIFRDGLRRLLETEPGFTVIGEAASGREAQQQVEALHPDVLILDFAMPEGNALDVLRALSHAKSTTRAVLLTAGAERQDVIEALQLGARGLLMKDAARPLVHKCVRCVAQGEYWLGHDRMPDLIEALREMGQPHRALPVETLTQREIEVIAAVVAGATNRDISQQLSLSEQTVKNHLCHIFDKVGVSNRLELALFAIHHKLLSSVRDRKNA